MVPMVHLTWNIARNIRINDRHLFELIKFILHQSLKYIQLTLSYLEQQFGRGVDVRKQLRTLHEPAHYCITCDCEVFNILFITEIDRKHVVRCLDCALQYDKQLENVVVLYQFTLDDLKTVYDQFQLYLLPTLNTTARSITNTWYFFLSRCILCFVFSVCVIYYILLLVFFCSIVVSCTYTLQIRYMKKKKKQIYIYIEIVLYSRFSRDIVVCFV